MGSKTRIYSVSNVFKPSVVRPRAKVSDSTCKSQDLLRDHGLIRRTNHASFTLLPLFMRSLDKLSNIVDAEMSAIGGQRIIMPTLIQESMWRKSGRLNLPRIKLDDFYKVTDRRRVQHFMAPTYEEPVTELLADAKVNEGKLPILLYQIGAKFRDEPRPRYGLLRTNEFIMKDLYSFDANLDEAHHTYNQVGKAYERIFNRLGLKLIKATSGVGIIGGLYSHEYHVECELGEDRLLICDSCNTSMNVELSLLEPNSSDLTVKSESPIRLEDKSTCQLCGSERVREVRGIEVGHTFLLADNYSKPQEAFYLGKNGENRPLQMGCYGLGLTRIIAAGIEKLSSSTNAKQNGTQIRWPNQLEPFKIGVITPKSGSKQEKAGAMKFCDNLVKSINDEFSDRFDILVDDRHSITIGRRLMDVQCLGIPIILVVGSGYLQDVPMIELFTLNSTGNEKIKNKALSYSQLWLTHKELFEFLRENSNQLD